MLLFAGESQAPLFHLTLMRKLELLYCVSFIGAHLEGANIKMLANLSTATQKALQELW